MIRTFLGILITCFLFSFNLLQAQDPCTTTPFMGYKGKCDIASVVSPDGKFLFTSDRLTLKKWELQTRKIVSDISFTSVLQTISDIPEYNTQPVTEDVAVKAMLDKNKLKPLTHFNANTAWMLAKKESRIVKINIASGNKVISTEYADVHDYAPLDVTLVSGKDNELFIFNLTSGAVVKADVYYSELSYVTHTKDKKFLVIEGVDVFSFVDVKTGKTAGRVSGQGNFFFKSDMSGFYFIRQQMFLNGSHIFNSISEYSYPEIKELNRLDKSSGKFLNAYDRVRTMMMDADRSIVYIRGGDYDDDQLILLGFKYPEGQPADTFSLKKIETQGEQRLDAKRKEANLMIANNAIARVNDVQEQSPRHGSQKVRFMHIDDFTPDGQIVMVREEYFRGGGVIAWKFPEGKPQLLVYDQEKTDGIGGSSIAVGSSIKQSFISPDSKTIGINLSDKCIVIRDNVVKFEIPNKQIIALYDEVFLAYSFEKGLGYKNLELISTSTGQVSQKVNGQVSPDVTVNTRFRKGKVYLHNSKEMHVFDIKNPSSLTSYKLPGVVPDAPLFTMPNVRGLSVLNVSTGTEEEIPGYRNAQGANEHTVVDGETYLLANRYETGWDIYNIQEGTRATPQNYYCGWTGFSDATFMKDANKLLVVGVYASYVRPNATDDDPGASAYILDLTTNVITPYLLTDTRTAQLVVDKAKREASWQYTPLTKCDKAKSRFTEGWMIRGGAYSPEYLYLGYDCDEDVYVMAQRVKDSYEGVQFNVVRFLKMRDADLTSYKNYGGPYEICPHCGGVTGGVVDTYYSGWTGWEQKYANIYTRKYVVNQKIKVLTHCQVCNGDAWYRKK